LSLKGEKKSKVFTVTISVPSVKVKEKQVHNYMSNHVFYSDVHIVHFELQNSIKVIHVTDRVATTKRLPSALFTHLQNKLDV